MKHLLKDANGQGNYPPYVDYSSSTITFQNTIRNKIKRNLVLWYDIKRQGATNETMAANPKLIDLSGNGHDATCYNFAWSGMSGIGGYATNFDVNVSRADIEILGTQKWLVKHIISTDTPEPILTNLAAFSGYDKTVTIVVSGIPDTATEDALIIKSHSNVVHQNLHNGENIVTFGNTDNKDTGLYIAFSFVDTTLTNITIEILPEYPNALVFDGVDDYAQSINLPACNDYSIIMKREPIKNLGKYYALNAQRGIIVGKNVFLLEYTEASNNIFRALSYGAQTDINFIEDKITFQTKNSYNGQSILVGTNVDSNGGFFNLFMLAGSSLTYVYAPGILYSVILFNRTLSAEEINWVKTNLIEGDLEL